ncbi:MAG: hypothetical protein AB7K09_09530 [Planctomycetota bacterium]
MRNPTVRTSLPTWLVAPIALVAVLSGAAPCLAQDDATTTRPLIEATGFDDAAFRFDSWAGWRILNSRNDSEYDNLVFGAGTYVSFSKWEVAVAFELAIREGRIALRADDYNELGDYFHILRRLQYSKKGEPRDRFFFRLGELSGSSGTIGHGTIIDSYHSVADYNSRTIGMQIDLDFDTFGFETLVNSFSTWNTVGIRTWLKPGRFSEKPHPVLKDFAIGVTLAGDLDAPSVLTADGANIALNGRRNILYTGKPLGLIGADVDVPLVDVETFQLATYADFVQIIDHGNGWFLGLRAAFELPLWDTLPLEIFAEWQQLSRGFIPSYFDAFYEVERFAFPALDSTTTRSAYLGLATPSPGFRVGLKWGVRRLVTFRGSFADYTTDRDNQLGRLMLEFGTAPDAPLPFTLNVAWIKRGVSSFEDAFALDDRAMLRFTTTIGFGKDVPLRIGLTIDRLWRVRPTTGRYESFDVWFPWAGIGLSW